MMIITFLMALIVVGKCSPIVLVKKNMSSTTMSTTLKSVEESIRTTPASTPIMTSTTDTNRNQNSNIEQVIFSALQQTSANSKNNNYNVKNNEHLGINQDSQVVVLPVSNDKLLHNYAPQYGNRFNNFYENNQEPEIEIVSVSEDDLPNISELFHYNQNRRLVNSFPSRLHAGYNQQYYPTYHTNSAAYYNQHNPYSNVIQNINPNIPDSVVDLIGKIIDKE